jgi:hypothetical protein
MRDEKTGKYRVMASRSARDTSIESRNKITGLVITGRYHELVTKLIPLDELAQWEKDVRADDAADFSDSAEDLYIIRAINEIRMWREAANNLKVAVDALRESRKQFSIDPGDSFDVEAAAQALVKKLEHE